MTDHVGPLDVTIPTYMKSLGMYKDSQELHPPLQRVLQGELNGCKQAIGAATNRSLDDPMRAIIIARRTQRIKELKAEALLHGFQLKE